MPQSSCTFISSLDLLKHTHADRHTASHTVPTKCTKCIIWEKSRITSIKTAIVHRKRRRKTIKNSHTDQSRDLLKTKYLVSGYIMSFSSFLSLCCPAHWLILNATKTYGSQTLFLFRRFVLGAVFGPATTIKSERDMHTRHKTICSLFRHEQTYVEKNAFTAFYRTFVGMSRRDVV